MKAASILIVGEQSAFEQQTHGVLAGPEYQVEAVRTCSEAVNRVSGARIPDVVLLDIADGDDGLRTVTELRRSCPSLKIIVLSSFDDSRTVVKAIRLGAENWLRKPCAIEVLYATLRECLGDGGEDRAEDPTQIRTLPDGSFFVAASPSIRRLCTQIEQVARINIPVLCLGESGTGKEAVARLLHAHSTRASAPFVKVNCAAVPSELLESELFGYERGAFTGATRSKPGKFELCHRGTLLLDEIAEIPPALQAKLLHVLQDQEFTRLGACTKIKVDVRIMAATNVDIQAAIASRRFREDLYYRLSTFVIHIPPLRERREDIPILLRRYIRLYASKLELPERAISQELMERCVDYSWPGNIRELENFAKRFLLFGEHDAAPGDFDGLPRPVLPSGTAEQSGPPGDLKSQLRGLKDDAEVLAIKRALTQTNWNRKKAARLLNISYKSILVKIRQYGLENSGRKASLADYATPAEEWLVSAAGHDTPVRE